MPLHRTLFLRRSLYERFGLFDTRYLIAADYDLMLRMLTQLQGRVLYLPEAAGAYACGRGQQPLAAQSAAQVLGGHVHIDHVGRLPYLLAAGYRGPILCSPASAELLPLVLEDALKVGFTRNQRLIEQVLAVLRQRLQPLPYGDWHPVCDGARGTVYPSRQRGYAARCIRASACSIRATREKRDGSDFSTVSASADPGRDIAD